MACFCYVRRADGLYLNHTTNRFMLRQSEACLCATREIAETRLAATASEGYVEILDSSLLPGWTLMFHGTLQGCRLSSLEEAVKSSPPYTPTLITRCDGPLPRLSATLYDVFDLETGCYGKKQRKNPYAFSEFVRLVDTMRYAKEHHRIVLEYTRNTSDVVRVSDMKWLIPREWHFLYSERYKEV